MLDQSYQRHDTSVFRASHRTDESIIGPAERHHSCRTTSMRSHCAQYELPYAVALALCFGVRVFFARG